MEKTLCTAQTASVRRTLLASARRTRAKPTCTIPSAGHVVQIVSIIHSVGTPSIGVLLRIQTNATSRTRTILGTAPGRSLGSRTAKNPYRRSLRRLVSRKLRRQDVSRSAEYTSAMPRYAHLLRMIALYRRVPGAQKYGHARRHSHFSRSCAIFFTRRLVHRRHHHHHDGHGKARGFALPKIRTVHGR